MSGLCCYLDISEVYSVQISQHLTDLVRVLQHSTCSLREVVQGSVTSESLRECVSSYTLKQLSNYKYVKLFQL